MFLADSPSLPRWWSMARRLTSLGGQRKRATPGNLCELTLQRYGHGFAHIYCNGYYRNWSARSVSLKLAPRAKHTVKYNGVPIF